ncbi:ATP-binding protein [Marinobacter sp. F3R08]|uniref:ATP-binding protein n=1 Tax=Marinobacter sp. F3R08 TaxID=2841559 RepID=UPI001C088E04|nr:ATP-binding protein [Marinobacter sp. F3R08]MBU2955896.1 ATP-binding protein [Marinobacter sp. F3R08]
MKNSTISSPVSLDSIEQILSIIENTLTTWLASPHELFEISTCCREALNNIVEHSGQRSFSTKLRFARVSGRKVLFVTFSHPGFVPRPDTADTMPLDSLSGRGWPIMEAWMDRVRHRSVNGATRLTLIRALANSPVGVSTEPCNINCPVSPNQINTDGEFYGNAKPNE